MKAPIVWTGRGRMPADIIPHNQGRPVGVKHDAQMHHGPNRGGRKKRELSEKNVHFAVIGGKCTNMAE